MRPHLHLILLVAGALLPTACSTGAKIATTAGSVAGKTALTALTTGGKVAGATVLGTASLAKTTVTTTGSVATPLAKSAFVTVVDGATGAARQVPWTSGMKLYTAMQTGGASQAVEVLRGAHKIAVPPLGQLKADSPGPRLLPGDIVTLR
ncbi:MAG: hypothetical protein RLZZ265_234 [Verrucomicrobiota bacterium]|jgi:hypothetical protein